ncbi:hypothetical protein BHE74_00004190 [Ensete ventricosum]|nr:hypothetical protein BHE74_00004190 [Ensete ventricosum]
MDPSLPKVAAVVVSSASNWWDEVNNSALWQDWIFHILAFLYGLVAAVALLLPLSRERATCSSPIDGRPLELPPLLSASFAVVARGFRRAVAVVYNFRHYRCCCPEEKKSPRETLVRSSRGRWIGIGRAASDLQVRPRSISPKIGRRRSKSIVIARERSTMVEIDYYRPISSGNKVETAPLGGTARYWVVPHINQSVDRYVPPISGGMI